MCAGHETNHATKAKNQIVVGKRSVGSKACVCGRRRKVCARCNRARVNARAKRLQAGNMRNNVRETEERAGKRCKPASGARMPRAGCSTKRAPERPGLRERRRQRQRRARTASGRRARQTGGNNIRNRAQRQVQPLYTVVTAAEGDACSTTVVNNIFITAGKEPRSSGRTARRGRRGTNDSRQRVLRRCAREGVQREGRLSRARHGCYGGDIAAASTVQAASRFAYTERVNTRTLQVRAAVRGRQWYNKMGRRCRGITPCHAAAQRANAQRQRGITKCPAARQTEPASSGARRKVEARWCRQGEPA